MKRKEKPLVWLHGEIKTPPLSSAARIEAGYLLRKLQLGELLSPPHSRPMPSIGSRCHELRIDDENKTWRVVYRIDNDAIVIFEVFEKKTQKTPREVIENLQERRKEKSLTQQQLARLLRSSQSRIAKMEAGDPSVSLDLLVRSLLILGESGKSLAKIFDQPA